MFDFDKEYFSDLIRQVVHAEMNTHTEKVLAAIGNASLTTKDVSNLPPREYFKPREVAKYLDLKDHNTVREWCKSGKVEAVKDDYSNRWQIPRGEVEKLIRYGGLPPVDAEGEGP